MYTTNIIDDLLLSRYLNQYYAMNNPFTKIIFIKYFRNVSTTINKKNLDIISFRPEPAIPT